MQLLVTALYAAVCNPPSISYTLRIATLALLRERPFMASSLEALVHTAYQQITEGRPSRLRYSGFQNRTRGPQGDRYGFPGNLFGLLGFSVAASELQMTYGCH